jgi:hypothetical protein
LIVVRWRERSSINISEPDQTSSLPREAAGYSRYILDAKNLLDEADKFVDEANEIVLQWHAKLAVVLTGQPISDRQSVTERQEIDGSHTDG